MKPGVIKYQLDVQLFLILALAFGLAVEVVGLALEKVGKQSRRRKPAGGGGAKTSETLLGNARMIRMI